jgi:hypothetical protein
MAIGDAVVLQALAREHLLEVVARLTRPPRTVRPEQPVLAG